MSAKVHGEVGTKRIEGDVLAELYAGHAGQALRLAFLLTGDRALAEDLVQDAFVRLAVRRVHLRKPGAFQAYLQRTVVNLSRSHYRHRVVERSYLARQRVSQLVEAPDLSDRQRMQRALMDLPIRQRTAVVLRYYEDLSEARTADLMNCRPAAVKSLVARGIGSLRRTLGDEL